MYPIGPRLHQQFMCKGLYRCNRINGKSFSEELKMEKPDWIDIDIDDEIDR